MEIVEVFVEVMYICKCIVFNRKICGLIWERNEAIPYNVEIMKQRYFGYKIIIHMIYSIEIDDWIVQLLWTIIVYRCTVEVRPKFVYRLWHLKISLVTFNAICRNDVPIWCTRPVVRFVVGEHGFVGAFMFMFGSRGKPVVTCRLVICNSDKTVGLDR